MNNELIIQNKKIELIQLLSSIEDLKLLEKISDLILNNHKDWWDEISEGERNSIEKGLKDSETGNVIEHSKARKIYEKWL